VLHSQLAWYIGGPILGLCVVAIRLLLNGRLGVTGGYSEVVEKIERRSLSFDWRGWFLIGLIAGAAVFALIAGTQTFHGYGWLTDTFDGDQRWLVAPILFVAGGLIGFGAKTAGGCTSGNGLSGTSMTSLAAIVATATFFATAIVVSFVIKAVI
jgi:uncharacterized membrane protein YedE/YeeE